MIKDTITFPDFVKLDLRVGTVESAEKVEGSDRLIKMMINLGEEIGVRQIVAGIALVYTPKDMLGKQVVVLVNLAPKKMMNLESEGMMLAAGETDFCPLIPEKILANGTIIR